MLLKVVGNGRVNTGHNSECFQTKDGHGRGILRRSCQLVLKILVGRPARSETSVSDRYSKFLFSEIIERGFSLKSAAKYSFEDIFEALKANEFRIEDDVDSAEVSAFVSWVESAE
jgi:hypothetical protein